MGSRDGGLFIILQAGKYPGQMVLADSAIHYNSNYNLLNLKLT